jgi:hypothetical protein
MDSVREGVVFICDRITDEFIKTAAKQENGRGGGMNGKRSAKESFHHSVA